MSYPVRPVIGSALNKVAAYFGFAVTTIPDVREAILLTPQELGDSPHLQCPHCLALDDLAEIDRSVRRNQLFNLDYGLDDHDRSGDLIVSVSEDDHNYMDDHFECSTCGGHVTIPDRVDVSWG